MCHDSEGHPVGILQLTGAQGGVERNMEATIGFRVQCLGLHKDYKKRLSGKDHGSCKSGSSWDLGKRKRRFHKGLGLGLSVPDILRKKQQGGLRAKDMEATAVSKVQGWECFTRSGE